MSVATVEEVEEVSHKDSSSDQEDNDSNLKGEMGFETYPLGRWPVRTGVGDRE